MGFHQEQQAFFEAAREGDFDRARLHINMESRDPMGMSLLHYAAADLEHDMCVWLHGEGFDPDECDCNGMTPRQMFWWAFLAHPKRDPENIVSEILAIEEPFDRPDEPWDIWLFIRCCSIAPADIAVSGSLQKIFVPGYFDLPLHDRLVAATAYCAWSTTSRHPDLDVFAFLIGNGIETLEDSYLVQSGAFAIGKASASKWNTLFQPIIERNPKVLHSVGSIGFKYRVEGRIIVSKETWTCTPLFTVLKSSLVGGAWVGGRTYEIENGMWDKLWEDSRMTPTDALKRWVSCLKTTGVDLTLYGKHVSEYVDSLSPEGRTFTWIFRYGVEGKNEAIEKRRPTTLRSIAYGPCPENWNLLWDEPQPAF